MFNGYRIIGLCITKIGNEEYYNFIRVFNEIAVKNGYRLFIYQMSSDMLGDSLGYGSDKGIFEIIPFDILEALLVWEGSFNDKKIVDKIIESSKMNSVPVIVYGRQIPGTYNIRFDAARGFEKLVRHVIEYHKATDTCFISGFRDNEVSELRLGVYKSVLEENGLPYKEENVFYGEFWTVGAKWAAQKIIGRDKLPQAIICANDIMAIEVTDVLRENDIKVPEDVIVTGYDGLTCAFGSSPAITTCIENTEDLSKCILDIIERLLKDEEVDEINLATVDFKIMQSCGCRSGEKPLNPAKVLLDYENALRIYQIDERVIYEMSKQIFLCSDVNDFKLFLSTCKLVDTILMFNEMCFDESINPTDYHRATQFDKTLINVFSTSGALENYPKEFEMSGILPEADHILAKETPVVFSALDFYGQSAGIMITYGEVNQVNYRKVQQTATLLNSALINFMLLNNLKYTTRGLREVSEHDYLTGLLNRTGLHSQLPVLIGNNSGMDKYVTLVSLDLNNLKLINDKNGHEDGDRAIKIIADAMRGIPFEHKLCCRYGGDEMIVVIICDDREPERRIRLSINEYLDKINDASKRGIAVSASIGTYTDHCLTFDFEKALEISDKRMYEDKFEMKRLMEKENKS